MLKITKLQNSQQSILKNEQSSLLTQTQQVKEDQQLSLQKISQKIMHKQSFSEKQIVYDTLKCLQSINEKNQIQLTILLIQILNKKYDEIEVIKQLRKQQTLCWKVKDIKSNQISIKNIIKAVNITIDAFPGQMISKNGKKILNKWKKYIDICVFQLKIFQKINRSLKQEESLSQSIVKDFYIPL